MSNIEDAPLPKVQPNLRNEFEVFPKYASQPLTEKLNFADSASYLAELHTLLKIVDQHIYRGDYTQITDLHRQVKESSSGQRMLDFASSDTAGLGLFYEEYLSNILLSYLAQDDLDGLSREAIGYLHNPRAPNKGRARLAATYGSMLIGKGKLERALAVFSSISEFDPSNEVGAVGHYWLALAAFNRGQVEIGWQETAALRSSAISQELGSSEGMWVEKAAFLESVIDNSPQNSTSLSNIERSESSVKQVYYDLQKMAVFQEKNG